MRYLLITVFFSLCLSIEAIAEVNVTSLSDDGFAQWEEKSFEGATDYQLSQIDNEPVIRAVSQGTASAMYLEKRIDLLETPYINWRWLTKQRLSIEDEHIKIGDDHVARVYVVIDGGIFPWRTKSINYVWSSAQAAGKVWDNPFAGDNVQMLAVRGAKSELDQWYQEKRNVYDDLIRYFGDKGSADANQKAYRYIDGIAIMTDTDNSGLSAETYFGDIIFTAN